MAGHPPASQQGRQLKQRQTADCEVRKEKRHT